MFATCRRRQAVCRGKSPTTRHELHQMGHHHHHVFNGTCWCERNITISVDFFTLFVRLSILCDLAGFLSIDGAPPKSEGNWRLDRLEQGLTAANRLNSLVQGGFSTPVTAAVGRFPAAACREDRPRAGRRRRAGFGFGRDSAIAGPTYRPSRSPLLRRI